jgi:hypothetical protein
VRVERVVWHAAVQRAVVKHVLFEEAVESVGVSGRGSTSVGRGSEGDG